ncbi:MAG TPA: helix-turn-helix domain-containing protein [bacterium]|nr:helix-turn-helix domain-containing protein [bacterium]
MSIAPVSESTSRQRLLSVIGRTGGCTITFLQRAAGLSRSTVRRHLNALMRIGAVTSRRNGFTRGRPAKAYALTAPMEVAAEETYPAMLDAIFARLRTTPPEQIEAMFPSLGRVFAAEHPEIRRIPDTAARLEAARQVVFAGLDSSPVTRTESGLQFSLHECPLASLALEFGELCCAARMVLSGVVGQDVEQSEWIVRGDPRCTFEIRRTARPQTIPA